MKLTMLLNLVIIAIFMNCSNPQKSDLNVQCTFILEEGFNQSRTILTLNNAEIMEGTFTSIILAPNSGSSHWEAAQFNVFIKKGSYKLNVKIEDIEKDTTITMNDSSLYNYISFLRDSSKIEIISTTRQPIWM